MVTIIKTFSKITLFCLFAYISSVICVQQNNCKLKVVSKKRAKVPLLVGVMSADNELKEIARVLEKDLGFSGQFEVVTKRFTRPVLRSDFETIFGQGFSLAVFLSVDEKDAHAFEWRVYDVISAQMVTGKKYTKRGKLVRGWGHNIADAVWLELTNSEGFFSTKIVYCKDSKIINDKKIKNICIADYDGGCEQVLVDVPTVCVAPRWNQDLQNPLVFYSEYTNANVRMMSVNLNKRRKIASNFDGINMLPTFARTGNKVVYCASNGKGSCQLYYSDRDTFRQLTHNKGNNVSPTLSNDGNTVFFCSDFQTGHPQVFKYDLVAKTVECITNGGYCASPSYCSSRDQVAYSKIINGTMQLFLFDCASKKHSQLTFDAGNKEECSWSPGGNSLVFSHELAHNSRIAMLNIATKERKFITSAQYNCSYPAWSPVYAAYPQIG